MAVVRLGTKISSNYFVFLRLASTFSYVCIMHLSIDYSCKPEPLKYSYKTLVWLSYDWAFERLEYFLEHSFFFEVLRSFDFESFV